MLKNVHILMNFNEQTETIKIWGLVFRHSIHMLAQRDLANRYTFTHFITSVIFQMRTQTHGVIF